MNIMHNVGQMGLFYRTGALQLGVKSDYAHSTLEGYWYESFYKVSPEMRLIWSEGLMTRLVGDWKEETFEEEGDGDNCRNNKSMGGTIYQHFAFLDGDLSGWIGYGYTRVVAGGTNYNRYLNSGHFGLATRWPLEIETLLMGRYDEIVYPDYHPGDRTEHKTTLNLSVELPIYQALKGYLGVGFSTVDATAERWEYERWVYSAGLFVDL
jgi:hypothetical protein